MNDTSSASLTIACDGTVTFDQLVHKHYQRVFQVAWRLTGNRTDAEDLTQEAFMRACRAFHTYRADMPFENWMFRITRNAFIDMTRRRPKTPSYSLDSGLQTSDGNELTLEIPDTRDEPETVMMREEIDQSIQDALMALGPDMRMTVVLSDIEGLSYEEIAEAMHCSIGTVRSRLHRGRKAVRDRLKATGAFKHLEVEYEL